MSDPHIDTAVRRVVGRAALRRLQRLVREDAEREAGKVRWARRIALALLATAVAGVLWLAIR